MDAKAIERLKQIEKESDERVKKRLVEANKIALANFNARTDLSIKVIPWEDPGMIIRQQGRRVSWMTKSDRYCSARHYVNADCAKQIIDELIRLGCKNCFKEDEAKGQIELF